MLKLKDSVRLVGIKPEIVLAMIIVNDAYEAFNTECVITSVNDSTHSYTSLHNCGYAFDVRTRNVSKRDILALVKKIQESLTGEFDIVLEETHLHIEFQPKTKDY